MTRIKKRQGLVAVLVGLLLFGGVALADTDFSEGFGTASTGCTAGTDINGFNNWVGPSLSTEIPSGQNFALCDVSSGEWGPIGNKFLVIESSPGTVGSGYAKHSISPSGAWSTESDLRITCGQSWGTVFFSLMDAVGMAKVGFADNDLSLDVDNGGSITYDVYTLPCSGSSQVHHIKLNFSSATASTYTVNVNSGDFSASYSTASTTTPSYVRFGTETASANENGHVAVDNVSVLDNL